MWVALLLALAARTALAACPRLCECKWRSGKESAVCQHADLDALPRPLDTGTQLLDLTGNRLAALPDDVFASAGLVNLQRIYLADCGLRSLRRHTFRNQTNLVELDLSRNRLEAVPSHALTDAPELRELRLDGNPISRLRNDAFAALSHLVRLDLSSCRIVDVEPRAFSGLEASLEFLELDGNRLRGLRAQALTSLRALHGLELAGNPWECTCELRPLRDWMVRRNVPATIVPECELPNRLASQPWDRLDLDEFACPPEVSAANSHASGYEGGEVTLACRVSGVPAPRVRWLRAGRPLANTTSGGTTAVVGARAVMLRGEGQLSNLTIRAADVQDAGAYTCAAENRAGRAEASVTLAVERRTWGSGSGALGGRAILAGVAVAALFVLASCLLALCAYEARKKRQVDRWNEQIVTQSRREDSYEKIEAEQKEMEATRAMCAAVAAAENRKRGDYRNVPSHDTEDEAEAYNEEMETPTPTAPPPGASWRPPGPSRSPRSPPAPRWSLTAPGGAPQEPDLHIPRLPEYSLHDMRNDSTPDSASVSTSLGAAGFNNNHPDDNHLNNNPPPAAVSHKPGVARVRLYGARPHAHAPPTRHDRLDNDLSGSDSEKNYPDLIEMSALGADSYLRAEREHRRRDPPDYAFCTLPRKRLERAAADSRSPLLPDSRYGSSGGDSSVGGSLERRASAEWQRRRPDGGGRRSNSFLNLAGSTGARSRHNPSLPTSPSHETPPVTTPSATPLLDLAGLRAASEYSRTADSSYSKEDSSYDFHASQLERFLEEYRSLREQLSKMKETRESLQRSRPAGAELGLTTPHDEFPKSILKGRPSVAVTAASSAVALDASSSLTLTPGEYSRPDWMAGALYHA